MARKKTADNIPFEEALTELEGIVQKLESSELKLDDSIELFSKGVELAGLCSNRLVEVQQQVQKVVEDSQGNLFLKPLQEDKE